MQKVLELALTKLKSQPSNLDADIFISKFYNSCKTRDVDKILHISGQLVNIVLMPFENVVKLVKKPYKQSASFQVSRLVFLINMLLLFKVGVLTKNFRVVCASHKIDHRLDITYLF